MNIDSMNCWIRSVEDAIQELRHHEQQQRDHSSRYFAPFFVAGRQRQVNTEIESDSTYTPSTNQEDDSLTTFTQSTLFTDTTYSSDNSTSTSNTHTSQSVNDSEQSTCSNDPPSIISWSTS
jgi:hypothetical protein